jgi:hypothetical protein
MVRLSFIISVILLFQAIGFGQGYECFQVQISDDIELRKEFSVKVILNVRLAKQEGKFIWNSSNGINQITNEPFIKIPTNKDDEGKEIKISLEIEGLPDYCRKSYETNIEVINRIPNYHPDWMFEYNLRSWNDEKLRLTEYAELLKEKKDSNLIIIIRGKNPKGKKILIRQQKIKNFLINIEKVDKERFKVIFVKSNDERAEYYIVPKEIPPPIK